MGVWLPSDDIVHDVRGPPDPRAGGSRPSMIDDHGQLIGDPGQLLAVRVPSGHVSRYAPAVPRVPRYTTLQTLGLGVIVYRC